MEGSQTPLTVPMHTGRRMPTIGLGTWQLADDTAWTGEAAFRHGYRMVDTAVDYGTQPGIGEAVARSGIDPNDLYLVSKVEEHEDAYDATVRNLGELRLDQADLMLIHRPPPHGAGRELWEGLIRARDEGLTTDIGVSNYSAEEIEKLIDETGEVPAVNQVEWTPFGWSPRMLEYCRQRHIVVQAYSPLTRARRLDDPAVVEIAASCRKSPAQVLLRWSLQSGAVPIPKANRRDHLEENIDVFDFELTGDQMARLNDLNEEWSSLGGALQYG